jgi:acetylornithine deacetylase/succinyl-diaminopimelate desuccinylase-like protein
MEIQPIVAQLDTKYLIDTLVELARVPTEVPLGPDVFMAPDDPKLVHYVQRVLRPKLTAIGAYDLIEVPENQLVTRYGMGTSDAALLLMVYTPIQHHNLMPEPFSGKVARGTAWGFDEPCVFAQGVTQNKAHHAIMLAVLKLLIAHHIPLPGTLYWAINNEGRSSHACSDAILAALPSKPDFAILLTATGQRISLGNRGRVDVNITIRGQATHSSMPQLGLSAIDGAQEVLSRLKRLRLRGSHPLLGGQHAIPYQVTYEPLAPHTLPETAHIRVDRRLLPGDDPAQATAEIRDAIGDMAPYQVSVQQGYHMLPALVEPDHGGVRALSTAHHAVHHAAPETYYGQGSFDAGGPCAAGVPAVMYGVGGGGAVLEVDCVPISQVCNVARVMTHTILTLLGSTA